MPGGIIECPCCHHKMPADEAEKYECKVGVQNAIGQTMILQMNREIKLMVCPKCGTFFTNPTDIRHSVMD